MSLTEGCSPLTFCSCLFCGPVVGVRGSALPALLAPLPGAAVAPAAPLAGPPLPPAGDLLEGLPVVLKKKTCEIRHATSSTPTLIPDVNTGLPFLLLSPYFSKSDVIAESSGVEDTKKRNLTMFIHLIRLQSLIITIAKKACNFQLSMYLYSL